jgi:drug/metabolite transporter (DMT)-like permease
MLLVGVVFTMEIVFLYSGLVLTTAARGTVLLYTAPFFIAIGSHWLLRDRLTPVRMAGLVLAFVGVALALSDRGGGPGTTGDWRGDLLCLAAGASWGLLTVIIKATPLRTERAERALLGQLAVSAALLLGASTLIGEAGLFAPSARVWAGMAWQVIAVASVSYLGFFVMVQRHSPAQIAAFTFLTPLFGVAFATAVLGEPLTPSLVGAAILIAGGIWLVNRR